MPLPKDPEKVEAYKELLSKIAKDRGFGKWMEGKHLSKEICEKISQTHKKIDNLPEEKERRSERAKRLGVGKWMEDKKCPGVSKSNTERFKGKTFVEIYGEEKAKIVSEKIMLSNRKRWEGIERVVDLRPIQGYSWEYSEWRTKVFGRDNYVCQVCKQNGYLEAHHIKSWLKYPELRYVVENGITLCKKHHKLIHKLIRLKEKGEEIEVNNIFLFNEANLTDEEWKKAIIQII